MVHVVLLGHGSRDPRHAATVRSIAARLHERSLRSTVDVAFLDHCRPTLSEALADRPAGEQVIVVPLLLTEAFHSRVDVPEVLERARATRPDLDVLAARVLGPAPGLVAAMELRLREAGEDPDRPGTGVLMVAAGTSDHAARAGVAAVAADWLAAPRRGTHAFVAGEGPTVDEGVRQLATAGATTIAVAPYLLAPGVLPDRAFENARRAGAALGVRVVVADVIGDAPEVLDLVPARAREAGS